MTLDKPLGDNENLIEIDKTSFGYTVSHKRGKRIKFTGSYERESEAIRVATNMAAHIDVCGEPVWYCVNYAFSKKS